MNTSSQQREHLKEIYENFLSASLSREYYACRLTRFKRINLYYELLLALGSSGVIAAWYIWKTPAGSFAWIILTGIVALGSALKPVFNLSKEIERYSKLYIGYADLSFDLKQIVLDIRSNDGLTQETAELLKTTRERYKKLALEDDPRPANRVLDKCQTEVERRYPSTYFWFPKK